MCIEGFLKQWVSFFVLWFFVAAPVKYVVRLRKKNSGGSSFVVFEKMKKSMAFMVKLLLNILFHRNEIRKKDCWEMCLFRGEKVLSFPFMFQG